MLYVGFSGSGFIERGNLSETRIPRRGIYRPTKIKRKMFQELLSHSSSRELYVPSEVLLFDDFLTRAELQ
jgi:hypothetical protein